MIVQTRTGAFHVFSHHDLISDSFCTYGEWAQHEIDFLAPLISAGNVVVDAGAFIGSHSRAFSDMVGESGCVYAFEPNPVSFELLKANAECASVQNIRVFNFGLGRKAATQTLTGGNDSSSNLGAATIDQASDSGGIRIERLDNLDLTRVDFIKIDVEGMELDVLLGAHDLFACCRPKIFAECNSIAQGSRLLAWARENGLVTWGVLSPAFNEKNFSGVKENRFGSAVEVGLLLLDPEVAIAFSEHLDAWRSVRIEDEDDLSLMMLHKPQYIGEIQSRTNAASVLGLAYPTELSSSLALALADSEENRGRETQLMTAQTEMLREEIAALSAGLTNAERLNAEHLAAVDVMTQRFHECEARFASEEARSIARLSQAEELQRALDDLRQAFEREEVRSIERLQRATELQCQLDETEAAFRHEETRSMQRLQEAEALRVELDLLHSAFAKEEARSVQRMTQAESLQRELERLESAFSAEEARSVQRMDEAEALQKELERLESAFAAEEARSVQRLLLGEGLQRALEQAHVAREETKAELDAIAVELHEQQKISEGYLGKSEVLQKDLRDLSELFEIELQEKVAALYAADEQLIGLGDRMVVLENENTTLRSRVHDLENRSFGDRLRYLVRRRLAR